MTDRHNSKHNGSYYTTTSSAGKKIWWGSVQLNGKRYKKSGFSTKEDAKKAIQELVDRFDDDQDLQYEKYTVEQYLEEWAPTGRIAPRTVGTRQEAINRMLPYIGNIPIQSLKARHLQNMYKKLEKEYATRTVRLSHEVLSKALRDGVKLGAVMRNPIDRLLEIPKTTTSTGKAFSKGQLEEILFSIDDEWSPLFIVSAFTGLRRGEVLGLTWECVDLNKGTVSVKKSRIHLKDVGDTWGEQLKTKASSATIPLNKMALDALKKQKLNQAKNRLMLGRAWKDTVGAVFTNECGEIYQLASPTRAFKRRLLKLGLEAKGFSLNALRRTCGSLMIQSGVNVKQVQGILRHANYATTMDWYVKNSEESLRDATDTLEKVFTKSG